jgi:ribosomal-protein-alanine N-acetyltransferase
MTASPVVSLLESAADLDAVLEVDAESFLRPWTRQMYEAELRNPSVTRIFLIRVDSQVAGYCATWFLPGELHINNLAIRPAYRRQRLASTLLAHVLGAAWAAGSLRATLEVRRSNHAARELYGGLGFRLGGVRRDYYAEPVEDALILWRDPPESPQPGQSG